VFLEIFDSHNWTRISEKAPYLSTHGSIKVSQKYRRIFQKVLNSLFISCNQIWLNLLPICRVFFFFFFRAGYTYSQKSILREIESGKIKCFLRFLIAITGPEFKKKCQISTHGSIILKVKKNKEGCCKKFYIHKFISCSQIWLNLPCRSSSIAILATASQN
jgi:hypothetical protein